MEQTQERRNIRIINREVLKYMALFMMGIGHLITFFYNGKKGSSSKFSKWIFYVFYPAHLLLAFAIQMMLK